MPELVVDFITSLDGYAAAEGWPGWWGLEGPEYLAWLDAAPRPERLRPDGREDLPTDVRVRKGWRSGTDVQGRCPKVVFSDSLTYLWSGRTRGWSPGMLSRR